MGYDRKSDCFFVPYTDERIAWQLQDGQGVFSAVMPGTMDVDHKIATCVYKR